MAHLPAVLLHGGFVVAWESSAQDGSGDGIYFRRYGTSARELFLKGWFLAVRQLNVRFDHFLGYDDHLSIRCALTKLGRVAVDFHYRVDNLTTGKLAAAMA